MGSQVSKAIQFDVGSSWVCGAGPAARAWLNLFTPQYFLQTAYELT